MALPINTGDREANKFVEDVNTDVALRVQQSKIDGISEVPIEIDVAHSKVHAEKYFSTTDVAYGVQSGAPKQWLITTPNTTTRYHIVLQVASDTSGRVYYQENPTVGSSGSGLTTFNNDRNSVRTSELLFFNNPTVIKTGSGWTDIIGSTVSRSRIGAGNRFSSEYILKNNTGHLIQFSPNTSNIAVMFLAEHYEV
jgi:hypothetical protein